MKHRTQSAVAWICLALSLVLPFVLPFVLPSVASAAGAQFNGPTVTYADAQPIDSATSFTVTAVEGYGQLVLTISLDRDAAALVTMACTESPDGGTTEGTLQMCTVSAGTCTSSDASWTKVVSADAVWGWRVDVLGFKRVTCSLIGTAATADDKVTVKGHLSTR